MGRRSARWDTNTYEMFIIGEQLRVQMHSQGQVKDRRYHLRKYKLCFIGRDVTDWLLKMYHVQSREEAVLAMKILKKYGIFHHVVDEHDFKDQHLFYRFTYDDDTYKLNRDLASFYRGLEIYRKLKANPGDVMRDFYHKGTLYSEAFYGCDAVDFTVVSEGHQERDSVIKEFRDLLERDIIKHVTDDYHFSDDRLIYEFNLDFNKPCILQDVIDMMSGRKSRDVSMASGIVEMEDLTSQAEMRSSPVGCYDRGGKDGSKLVRFPTIRVNKGKEVKEFTECLPLHIKSLKKTATVPRDSIDSAMSGGSSSPGSHDVDNISVNSGVLEPRSVLVRPTTVQELEDPNAPYVKRCVVIDCDDTGFGFVLRGSSPCYVQTVDPLGPAAAAGLKVRQFLTYINGQNVLRMDHRQIGQIIAQNNRLSITVLMYRRDATRSEKR